MPLFPKFIFGIKLYMFQIVRLSIIRSFSLYTQQWYMLYRFVDSLRAGSGCNWFGSTELVWFFFCTPPAAEPNQFRPDPARKLSANLYDIYHCCVYSEKLLMMDIGTVRNM